MNIKPCNRFTKNSPWRQYLHILSELCEVFFALLSGNKERIGEELMDTQVACETMRVCCGIKDRRWGEIKLEVVRKNLARGYYQN